MEGGTTITVPRWELTWNGETYREVDLTLGDAEDLEQRLGLSWLDINPIRSARQARVILAHLAAARTAADFDVLAADLGRVPAEEFQTGMWHVTDVDVPAPTEPPADARWELTFDGLVFREVELTIAEHEALEARTGVSWLHVDPVRHARLAVQMLAHLVAARTGVDFDEVRLRARAIPVGVFLTDVRRMVSADMPGSYIDGHPPVAAAERSTGS